MNNRFSIISIFIVVVAALLIDVSFKKWLDQEEVIKQDVHSYYGYLPATFIFKDIGINSSDYQYKENAFYFWLASTNDGKSIFKERYGLAILYSPFFIVAHSIANIFNYPTNGFSEPYLFMLLLSAVFYLYIGLWYVRQTLLFFKIPDISIGLTIILLGLGTNLLCYSTQSAPMPHVFSFSLMAMIFYYCIKVINFGGKWNLIAIGILWGLITLIEIRNALIVFCLLVVFSSELKRKLKFSQIIKYLLFFLIPVILLWIPQFLYWKKVLGVYTWPTFPVDKYYFNDPKIWDGLFSFRKGWFVYSPLLFFAFVGFFYFKGELKTYRMAIGIYFVIVIYVIFSYWNWWYGGSFGQRPLIDSYSLLALPFAVFISEILKRKAIIKILSVITGLFFIWLNIFQTYQYNHTSLHWEGMTKELYFKQFGKYDRVENFDSYVSWMNEHDARNGIR
jgi:hypothetical protein